MKERGSRPRLFVALGVLLVVVAMAMSTKIVDQNQAKAALRSGLDPAAFAVEKYESAIAPAIVRQAVDIVTVAQAIEADRAAAATKYAKAEGSSAPVYSVTAVGTAGEATAAGIMPLAVKGMPDGVRVYVQMGPALNGTAVRDATGTVHFQQFVNQMDYQAASDQLNNQVKEKVLKAVQAASLNAKTVRVTGVFQLVNPAAFMIIPVKIEVSP